MHPRVRAVCSPGIRRLRGLYCSGSVHTRRLGSSISSISRNTGRKVTLMIILRMLPHLLHHHGLLLGAENCSKKSIGLALWSAWGMGMPPGHVVLGTSTRRTA